MKKHAKKGTRSYITSCAFVANPHEVIQSRESTRVGANCEGGCKLGANDNMMRKKDKFDVIVNYKQGFQIYMNCRTLPRIARHQCDLRINISRDYLAED